MRNMTIELQKLSLEDGEDIYQMLQEIPASENGFENHFYGLIFSEYKQKLKLKDEESRGKNLSPGYVQQTLFWLYVNDRPVGVSKLRHQLTEQLREHGGHIGYGIRASERGKGYATKMLELTLIEAKKLGINEVLITCNPDNIASQKVVLKNKGVLEKKTEDSYYYWIDL